MRQVQTTVAVNFSELLMLKRGVKQILDQLHASEDEHILLEVSWNHVFRQWGVDHLSEHWVAGSEVPEGCSALVWVELILAELENLLNSGGKFTVISIAKSPDAPTSDATGRFQVNIEAGS